MKDYEKFISSFEFQSRLALALVSLRQAWLNLETDTGRILLSFAD